MEVSFIASIHSVAVPKYTFHHSSPFSMFMMKSSKKAGLCQTCSVTSIVLGVISILATLAALIGVYKAHFLSAGLTFGTLNDSAALIALVLNLFFFKKIYAMCCGCSCEVPAKK